MGDESYEQVEADYIPPLLFLPIANVTYAGKLAPPGFQTRKLRWNQNYGKNCKSLLSHCTVFGSNVGCGCTYSGVN